MDNKTIPSTLCVSDAVLNKVDLFMRRHVLPRYRPDQIFWWFSLSGGKDSYTMCHSVYRWYKENGCSFNGSAFTVRQWANRMKESLRKQIDWLDVIELDARKQTEEFTAYRIGEQAPCSVCSNVRKMTNDEYIKRNKKDGFVNVIARGLHLSDTAISFLWRWAFYDDYSKYSVDGKYRPLQIIDDGLLLTKPLCYVREKESQDYAEAYRFIASCCGCPACRFPSRRDIVEETLLDIYRELNDEAWEFSVPGIDKYIESLKTESIDTLKEMSIPGFAAKHNHISNDFYDYAVGYFQNSGLISKINIGEYDSELDLDLLASRSIQEKTKHILLRDRIPLPRILNKKAEMTPFQKKMAATLGPFWGSIAYTRVGREYIQQRQKLITGFYVDEKWSQVNRLLNMYYKGVAEEDAENESKEKRKAANALAVGDCSCRGGI